MVSLQVRSMAMAEEFLCERPWACISISTQFDGWPDIDPQNRVDLLQLAFADVVRVGPQEYGFPVFSEKHALEVLDFIDDVWEDVEVLMVHCEAGISRSSAVAAAISKIKYHEDSEFTLSEIYDPNPLVYQTILAVAYSRYGDPMVGEMLP